MLFGISGVDMLLFYLGGIIMDRFGRVWVAVPSMIVLGIGFLLLPLSFGPLTVGAGRGAAVVTGALTLLGAGWLAHWCPRTHPRARRARPAVSGGP